MRPRKSLESCGTGAGLGVLAAAGCSRRPRRACSTRPGAGLARPKEIQDEELQGFCSRIIKLLREDLGPAAVDALQRLFLIVWATKYPRRLDKTCVDLLQATLCLPTCPEQLQVLCAAILREMSPSDSLTLSCDRAPNTRQMSLVASVLLAQGDRRQEVRSVGQRIFTVLESRQPEGPSLRHLLPVLSKVVGLAPGTLQEDQTDLLSKRLVDWLRHASVQQGLPHSGGFFSTPRARQPGPITEVDGAVASDFFTVLSTGQHFTEDQWLNVQAFSMLRAWLLHKSPEGPSTLDTDDKSELEGSTLSVLSAASTATRLLPPRERLREAAFEYCQRLIEQSNRRALRKGDADLQKACLVEAILILDVLCRQDPSFLYRTLSCLKALHTRLGTDPGSERAVLPLAQFFLNHGEAAAVGSEAIYQHLLTRLPSEHFHNPMLAFEVIRFCRDNLPLFDLHLLGILKSSFPNLFKFLAWNSPPLTSEFVGLLPALVDAGTAVEMLHTLLDLPCLTAALHLQLRSSSSPSERLLWDASLRTPSCLEAFRDPQCQGLFQHLLRTKASGSAERLTLLHQLLQPMASCARVAQCAEAVPALLQAFFSAVIQSSRLLECWWLPLAAPRELNPGGAPGDRLVTAWLDAGWAAWASLQLSKTAPCLAGRLLQGEPQFAGRALTTQLALLLLERSDSLYQVPQYEARVQRVLSSQFLALCQRNPSLVVELARELLDFVGSVSNIHSRAGVFTSVVWAIGEYLSVTCDRRCTVEQINKFFEALEALLFEVTQSRPSADQPRCPPQVVTVLMTTLTKLASRSQDLIPRVSLFLSKMRTLAQGPASSSTHSEEDAEAIRIRATELLNLLKMPSVAQFVFTPSAEVCHPRYHRDTNMSLPLALRMVSRLVEKESSLLPG
ncbi:AP-5 complex subunit zeta-1 isoform X2 [Marmota marmota marmota]|uniref:AP-5 complex subunit zeta-1 isoform X2 n=1 Tax=Marmota marmota marmota TaxID=9994 RepID=UPI0020922D29|nr:AP-5 complex subunit zeta-1 isoform X2 [Marmota marmota marmota]